VVLGGDGRETGAPAGAVGVLRRGVPGDAAAATPRQVRKRHEKELRLAIRIRNLEDTLSCRSHMRRQEVHVSVKHLLR